MLELSQLRCFVAVADQLNFSRAAAQLNMTQPPLSRQVQLLEREIGVLLLERNNRSVKLTPAGRIFLPEARRILRLSDDAVRWTQRVWQGTAGTLRIGFTAASGYGMLPDLMARVRDRMPDVDIVLREMVSSTQVEALTSDLLDVGFVRPPVNARMFESHRYLSEDIVVALPKGHDLARREAIGLADLNGRPFIMYSPEVASYFHDLLRNMFDQARVQPRVVHQVAQMHSMLALVDARFGAAVVPAAAMRLHFPNVVFRPLGDDHPWQAHLEVVWSRQNDNPALKHFLRACTNVPAGKLTDGAAGEAGSRL